jgi:hypothetical protein
MAAQLEHEVPWSQDEDPKADTTLVLDDGKRLIVRRAIIDLCESPVFDALSSDDNEIHVLGFTFEQVDLFLKYIHPKHQVRTTISVILLVMPVAHFYGVGSLMSAFVQYLQEDAVGGDACMRTHRESTLDALLLVESLRTRSEGSCPWSEDLLLPLMLDRIRASKSVNAALWVKMKLETQIAMLDVALRGTVKNEDGPVFLQNNGMCLTLRELLGLPDIAAYDVHGSQIWKGDSVCFVATQEKVTQRRPLV